MNTPNPNTQSWIQKGYDARFQGFQSLMRHRVRDILLVSSLYDLYIFEEDGRLYEMVRDNYLGLNLTHAPEVTQVSSSQEAIDLLSQDEHFDLILVTLHVEDIRPAAFAKTLKEMNLQIPVVMLAFDNKELSEMLLHHEVEFFDNIFIWQGDYRLVLAIAKSLEDKQNVAHDTELLGVQSIIIIEDDILHYSSLLPMIYQEVMRHSQRLIQEGINLSHRRLRMRARPKILLCHNYEEAWDYFQKYQETILGVISDVDFPKEGKECADAGVHFAREVKKVHADIAILLHSNNASHRTAAEETGASFLLKDTPNLLHELHQFMITGLSFGDFVFKTRGGKEVGRANDLLSLENQLALVPDESIELHASRNHFSNWLKARTEFWLAHELRPRRAADYENISGIRKDLIQSLKAYRQLRQRGMITDFDPDNYDPDMTISRIGGGSLGGKARGLSFVNNLINNLHFKTQFQNVRITIPASIILATDIFDRFLDDNDLRDFALQEENDQAILDRFLRINTFPEPAFQQLAAYLDQVDAPLAVRSSSLLEDSHVHPFAGVYKTYMLPNTHDDPFVRLLELAAAIKKVYASVFFQSAKRYIKATPYRLEEEKMAIMIQKVVGTRYGERFYPSFSGVAKSYNFYPVPPQKYTDGIVHLALGMGKMVVEGGACVRICPAFPNRLNEGSQENLVNTAQKHFYAICISECQEISTEKEDLFIRQYSLKDAEADGTLSLVGSTWSAENQVVYDGISRPGMRLVTFASMIKSKLFPVSDISKSVMDLGSRGMGTPVEIEFAVNMSTAPEKSHEFAILQMRPIVQNRELEVLNIDACAKKEMICQSTQVLGNDSIEDIKDIVVVDKETFDRAQSKVVAGEISRLNKALVDSEKHYLLIGVGRWGSLDPWLGIPVTWDQIAGAKIIVEAGFKDMQVDPSQGSHFFQNLHSFHVGFLTIDEGKADAFVDWDWLKNQPAVESGKYTRHITFKTPVIAKLSAHQNRGVILKPKRIEHV